MKKLLIYGNVFWKAGKRLYNEQFTYRAAALAFTTLLAIVPLLFVMVYLLSIFTIFNHFAILAQNYIFTNFIPTSSNLIQKYLFSFTNQASHLPTFGSLFLLITAISLIVMIEDTFNTIWITPKHKKTRMTLLMCWLFLLFAPIFIGMSVFLSSYLFSIPWFSNTTNLLRITIPLINSLPIFINTMIFSALYIFVPNTYVNWRSAIISGFIASLLFEVAKNGFSFYIVNFPSYEFIYGTIAAIPIFLVWVYISWLIILYGALLTHAFSQIKN